MTINKKKLDLKFGAEIKEFVSEPISEKFKSTDGIVYFFDKYKTNSEITKLMTKGFQYIQSINVSNKSKLKTNSSINFSINRFLKWIEEIEYKDKLNRSLLIKYKEFLTTNYSSWSTYSLYTVIARIVSILIEKKMIEQFIVPKNIPLEQAKNSSKTGVTLATAIIHDSKNLSIDYVNEKILSLIIDSTWEEIFYLFDKLAKGKYIKNNVSKKLIPYNSKMIKEEALTSIINNMFIEFNGISDKYFFNNCFVGYDNNDFIQIMHEYFKANRKNQWKINTEEINKYLNPSKELSDLILILLSAAQINPESASDLQINCLENDVNENIIRLSWNKNRSGGMQQSIPFPKGKNEKSKTIPNVIKLFKEYSEDLRFQAPENLKNQLFIFKNYKISSSGLIRGSTLAGNKSLTTALNIIKKNLINRKDKTIEYNLAIKACSILTLSLIRNTAINISSKRLNRDISNVATMDGRKTEKSLTENYLNNQSTREAFDTQIRESQNLMVEWVSKKPTVLINNTNEVIKKLNISKDFANKILSDEFNNGYGAALINDNVIIIDTPLNALRMIQWLKKLEESEPRMVTNNPERWFNLYLPQKKLFNEALSLISKKNKSEAIKMNSKYTLPFPEVL